MPLINKEVIPLLEYVGEQKYQIIYADPPWHYENERNHNPALGGMKYDTMPLEDVCALPVSQITDKNCLLFMWVTMPKLEECFSVIKAWGFKYTTCAFRWIKLNKNADPNNFTNRDLYSGLGSWVNGNEEICLLAKKGSPKRFYKNVKQLTPYIPEEDEIDFKSRCYANLEPVDVYYPLRGHSAKPLIIRDKIVKLAGDLPRIELFARQSSDTWDVWGEDVTYRLV
jgi:N6-adenosine-specific RNA methylase IME4